jgi:probable addiction module antidote protein
MPVKNNAAIKASAIKKLGIKPFDVADHLTTPEMIDGFLNEVVALGDPTAIQHALGTAARAYGMTKVAKATGLSRENLYRSLSAENNANFGTILRVIDALGLELVFKSKKTRKIGSKGQTKSGKRIAAEVRPHG